jgi:tetraacyldisaccharide 4'-kinase
MGIFHTILMIMQGQKKAPIASVCLQLLSVPYRFVVALRNFCYDRGILPSQKLKGTVVSIGNVVAGGTGKTPLTQLLATCLQDHMHLGILTRGYRSHIEKQKGIKQISTGTGPLCSAAECGDEPFLLAQKTKASIWVGADRVTSGKRAIAQGIQCLLLDDGMQHRRLKRDFEIVVIDGRDPFSKGRFLPWGMLRDSPKRLENATLIVATHVKDSAHFAQLQALIPLYSLAPLVGSQIAVLDKEHFKPGKVGVFCGIGKSAYFLQTVRDLKSEIIDTLILEDHGSLRQDQLEAFAENCLEKGAKAILCTEKDYVKLPRSQIEKLPLEIVPVAIEMKIVFGREDWDHLIEKIKVEK